MKINTEICKTKAMNCHSQQKFLFVQTFSVFHNMLQPTWPSSGNTTVYEICGRKSTT